MTTYDHYVEARIIADHLAAEGFPEQAQDVCNAIDDGRSGTEIFMKLRFYLSPFDGNVEIDPETRSRIAVLLGKINEALTR